MTSEDLIRTFEETGALLQGHFVLRSGLHSRQFFQCARVLELPETANRISEALAAKVRNISFDSVISPAMGGILVGHDLARHLKCRHIFAEKAEGKLVIRRFNIKPGERFIVAEDVVTTGSAVKETCKLVTDSGGIVAAIATIVNRGGDQSQNFDVPFFNLLSLKVETFSADNLPADLEGTPATKPGSK